MDEVIGRFFVSRKIKIFGSASDMILFAIPLATRVKENKTYTCKIK